MIDYRLLLMMSLIALSGCANKPPESIGASDGRLADCPWVPRCVSSQSNDPDSRIAPIHYSGSLAVARQTMLDVIRHMEGSRIVKVEERYLHTRFQSDWLGFVDDVEFLFVPDAQLIHVRSSARLGLYDFDINRDRINTIRARFLTSL